MEDPQAISSEKYGDEKPRRPFRKSDLRELISNPRYSTFRQLPTDAIAYHPPPQAPLYVPRRKQNDTAFSTQPPKPRDEERVTVLFTKGKPVLHLRLSDLELPSPVVFADEIKTRPNLDWVVVDRSSTVLGSNTTRFSRFAKAAPGTADILEPPNSGFLSSRAQSFDGRPRESINSYPSFKSDEQHPAQIIVGPRTIGKPARAQVYQALRPIAAVSPGLKSVLTTASPSTFSPVTFSPESKRYSPVISKNPRRGTAGTDGFSRSDSQAFTIRSASSSIKAVRELAPQFPGLPPSTWKDGTGTRSSSGTARKQDSMASVAQLAYTADDDNTPTQPILFVPKNDSDDDRPVSFNQISRAPSPSPLKPSGLFPVRPIDPFDDDESNKSPGGRESVPSPLNAQAKLDGESLLSTTFSNLSTDTISSVKDGEIEFKDGKMISAAIVTGNSGVFNTAPAVRTPAPLSPRTRGLIALGSGEPDPAQASSPRTANFRRIAQWVDTTEKTMTPHRTNLSIPSPIAVGGASSISVQNLHERGLSIDNLTIRWVKSETEQRKLKMATTPTTPTGYKGLKVRNIGRAPSRSTPAIQTGDATRKSLHLEQIYHPPPIETLPTIIKGKENTSPTAKRGQVLSKLIIPPLEKGATVAVQGDMEDLSPAKKGVLSDEEVLTWAD